MYGKEPCFYEGLKRVMRFVVIIPDDENAWRKRPVKLRNSAILSCDLLLVRHLILIFCLFLSPQTLSFTVIRKYLQQLIINADKQGAKKI